MSAQAQRSDLVPLREAWPLWMTAETAAKYLDFSNCTRPRHAFVMFARRASLIPRGRRGDVPLWHRPDLDKAVTVLSADRVIARSSP